MCGNEGTRPRLQELAVNADCIVSIVVPTFNRHARLVRCVDKIKQNVDLPHEIIVVDGASTDGTRPWLQAREDLVVILEPCREGAVKAFNKGFRAARGTYVTWLNDDAFPLPGSIGAAVRMIERPDLADVGMVALYHNWHQSRNVLDAVDHEGERYEIYSVRGYPYANFGLLRRSLLERIGYADERYFFSAFDPDLSLKIQIEEGLKVVGCRAAFVSHEELHDERKVDELEVRDKDNAKLFEKWDLPARNSYADPAPAYRRMLAERDLLFAGEQARTTHA